MNSALLVIDVQNDVVIHAHDRDVVIATIQDLVLRARSKDVPVIWVQHADDELVVDTDGWKFVSELVPAPGEAIVHKHLRNGFEQTTLASELAAKSIERLIITGAQTDFCVRWTLHGALDRGFDTVLVSDGHTTDDPTDPQMPSARALIAHTNAVWEHATAPTCTASVASAHDVSLRLDE